MIKMINIEDFRTPVKTTKRGIHYIIKAECFKHNIECLIDLNTPDDEGIITTLAEEFKILYSMFDDFVSSELAYNFLTNCVEYAWVRDIDECLYDLLADDKEQQALMVQIVRTLEERLWKDEVAI